MRLALTDQDDPMTAGFVGSIIFHIFILSAIVFGVPSFFEPEILPQPLGIEAAIVSDITAAPRVQQPSNKKPEKPKEQPAPEKEKPKAETPPPAPPAPAAPPPPPPPVPEQQAVAIPDPTQKPEEKKPEEKKPEEPKKETKKPDEKPKKKEQKQDDAFKSLLNSVLKDAPAPEPQDKPKKQAAQPPAEPTTGPQTELASDVPMTSSDEDGIRQQIEQNWSIDPGAQGADQILIELRVSLRPDGTVTKVEILNNQPGNGTFDYFARGARTAVLKASPLKLPPGKYWPTIKLRFNPQDVL
jgi:hypothetical protein